MIIENEASVTEAVLDAYGRTADPRMREILLALVRHLHGFVREVRLRSGSSRRRRGSSRRWASAPPTATTRWC